MRLFAYLPIQYICEWLCQCLCLCQCQCFYASTCGYIHSFTWSIFTFGVLTDVAIYNRLLRSSFDTKNVFTLRMTAYTFTNGNNSCNSNPKLNANIKRMNHSEQVHISVACISLNFNRRCSKQFVVDVRFIFIFHVLTSFMFFSLKTACEL